jgi:DNA-binding beta-propeller fold protein YncE
MSTRFIAAVFCSYLATFLPVEGAGTFSPQSPEELSGTQGRFDFVKIDPLHHRLLACHTGNGSLDVIDLRTGRLTKSIPTGAAQGVTIDDQGGRYFVSASKPPKLVIIDSANLEVTGEVTLPEPADLVAYHQVTNRLFVCNDEKAELWVIDPDAKRILTTLSLPGGGLEDLGFESQDKYLFQCLKDSSELAKIDPQRGRFLAKWSTLPAEKPHGLAIVPGSDAVLVAGGTGKLILMSLTTGEVLASCDVSSRIDEIAYDPGTQRVYCASGLGVISVVEVGEGKLTPLTPLASSPGAHSIAIDPQTHTIWIAFAKDGKSYIQSFTSN